MWGYQPALSSGDRQLRERQRADDGPSGCGGRWAQVTARRPKPNLPRTPYPNGKGPLPSPSPRPYQIALSPPPPPLSPPPTLDARPPLSFPLPLPYLPKRTLSLPPLYTHPEPAAERAQLPRLALLVPGVSPTNVGGTQLFPETSAVPGVGLSVGSQRNLSNNFIVDGLSANDDAAAERHPYGVDAVEQFQVVTSGGQAELGRALGGYVNVVTKSGTNTRARRPLRLLPRRRLQRPERAVGHEAADDAEAVRRQPRRPASPKTARSTSPTSSSACSIRPGLTTISTANVAIVNARLAAVGYPGPRISTGVYPEPGRHRRTCSARSITR